MQRVLLADSDQYSAVNMARILEQRGCRLAYCGDGQQVINFCGQHTPDVIVLDVDLPGTDGWAVMSILKDQPKTANIPVIGLSSHATPQEYHQAQSLGFAEFEPKPLDMESFLAKFIKVTGAQSADSPSSSTPAGPVRTLNPFARPQTNPLAEVNQMIADIMGHVEKMAGREHEFGPDGPEMFGYVQASGRQIIERLQEIANATPTPGENPLYDKETRHDFRNMIGSVTGFSELILMEATISTDSRGRFTRIREICRDFVAFLDEQKAAAAA